MRWAYPLKKSKLSIRSGLRDIILTAIFVVVKNTQWTERKIHFAKLGNCTCYNQKIAFQNRARVIEE